ncbi:HTH domain-containing protein [Halobacteriales archaeon Cl-PHB]
MSHSLHEQRTIRSAPDRRSTPDDAAEGEDPPAGDRLVLWTRRPVCGRPTAVIDRLGALRSAGSIADFAVETWPAEVRVEGETPSGQAIDAFERFEAWADANGLSIRPPFEVKTVSPMVAPDRTVLRLPMLCLAVYEGSDLYGVYPCSDASTTYRITDCLEAYDADAADT